MFPFSTDTRFLVTKYMNTESLGEVMNNLSTIMHREQHSTSANVLKGSHLLSDPSTCWKQTTKKCIDIMKEANSSEEDTDFTAGSVLFRLAPRLTSLSLKSNESSCQDNFVHHYLDDVLDGVLSQEPLLQQECPLPTSTSPTRTQQQQQQQK
ncbi:hypothetical protein BC941DRAFT_473332 [Chlamydoabsidia padenii]|nr:hypothetical protein BC941DRAFT_473332 [Chlamydoabsidia padenii]